MNELSFRQLRKDLLTVSDLLAQGVTKQHEELCVLTERLTNSLPLIERLLDEISEPQTDRVAYKLNISRLKNAILSGEFDDIPACIPVSSTLAQTTIQFLRMARDLFETSEGLPPETHAGLMETLNILTSGWEATERLFTDGDETIQ